MQVHARTMYRVHGTRPWLFFTAMQHRWTHDTLDYTLRNEERLVGMCSNSKRFSKLNPPVPELSWEILIFDGGKIRIKTKIHLLRKSTCTRLGLARVFKLSCETFIRCCCKLSLGLLLPVTYGSSTTREEVRDCPSPSIISLVVDWPLGRSGGGVYYPTY